MRRLRAARFAQPNAPAVTGLMLADGDVPAATVLRSTASGDPAHAVIVPDLEYACARAVNESAVVIEQGEGVGAGRPFPFALAAWESSPNSGLSGPISLAMAAPSKLLSGRSMRESLGCGEPGHTAQAIYRSVSVGMAAGQATLRNPREDFS